VLHVRDFIYTFMSIFTISHGLLFYGRQLYDGVFYLIVDKMLTLFSLRTAKLLYKCHCVYIHTYTLSTYHHNRLQLSSSSPEVVMYFFVNYCIQNFSFSYFSRLFAAWLVLVQSVKTLV